MSWIEDALAVTDSPCCARSLLTTRAAISWARDSEVALAIEMGADAIDIGKTIHPHPTLGESIGMTAEVAHSSCTDVLPTRK